jgi:predicted nucleic acid-binding protein
VIAYLDSSVLLRIVLREPNPLREWDLLTLGITSTLTKVESARAMHRLVLLRVFEDDDLLEKQREIADILRRLDYVPLTLPVLDHAARPLPAVLGALDAIHLATAILYRASQPSDERPIFFATHDEQLARAARALNFDVLGVAA